MRAQDREPGFSENSFDFLFHFAFVNEEGNDVPYNLIQVSWKHINSLFPHSLSILLLEIFSKKWEYELSGENYTGIISSWNFQWGAGGKKTAVACLGKRACFLKGNCI